jgi:hypothetical protein
VGWGEFCNAEAIKQAAIQGGVAGGIFRHYALLSCAEPRAQRAQMAYCTAHYFVQSLAKGFRHTLKQNHHAASGSVWGTSYDAGI